MKKAAIFLHGFNVRDNGAKSTDLVIPYFEQAGYECFQHDYGWTDMLLARLRDGELAQKVNNHVEELHSKGYEVTVVGHSNGGCIGWCSTELYIKGCADYLLMIAPALEVDEPLGDKVKKAIVLYSPDDGALAWVNMLVVKLLAPQKWGKMGKVGYQGHDSRVVNINIEKYLSLNQPIGHSGTFKKNIRDKLYPKVIKEFLC